MKTIRTILLFSILGLASVSHAGFVAWSGGNYNNSVNGVQLQAGWLVALFQDVNKDNSSTWYNDLQLNSDGSVSMAGTNGTSNDQLLGIANYTAMLANPITTYYNFSKTVQAADNINIYTVLFNSTNVTTATQYIVADSVPTDSGTGGAGSPVSYNIGSTFTGAWQTKAIPEPAVATLIGLFGGGLLLGRRIFKKV